MIRKEFERVSPESVGISSMHIEELISRLESNHTEMHGIMIMRYGKVCTEGWWNPYSPGLRHGLQSLTKTYAATAIGIACTEGLLSLDTKIIDIFTEEAPVEPEDNLGSLKVRDVLCMGCGMEKMPKATKNWIRDFLHIPVKHTPGTTFMYNSMGSSLLGAIVRKLTGLGLQDYLKPRLFDKIGIDADNLRWFYLPDGMEVGGGGLFATTEDNLRLMKLYMDGGVWEGERILSEDYVKKATSFQNASATEALVNPPGTDNFLGYGYQIWMCKPEGVYRADGAMGQFAICCPRQDMNIALNETAFGAEGIQKTLDYIWEFLDKIDLYIKQLPEDKSAEDKFSYRMSHLSIKNPDYSPYRKEFEKFNSVRYIVSEGKPALEINMIQEIAGGEFSDGIKEFEFYFNRTGVMLRFWQDGADHILNIAVDGSRFFNKLSVKGNVVDKVLMSGCFINEQIFSITARWPETCFEKTLEFHFKGDGQISIKSTTMPFCTTIPGGTVKANDPEWASAKIMA